MMPYKDPKKQKAAQKKHYLRNKEKIRATQNSPEQRRRNREGRIKRYAENCKKAQVIKDSQPCMDCKKSFPHYVLDFDHVRGEKVASVSALLSNGFAWEVVLEEIEKCEVVCANCHRERTHMRKGVEVQSIKVDVGL